MNCQKCGAPYTSADRFCQNCGSPVSVVQTQPNPAPFKNMQAQTGPVPFNAPPYNPKTVKPKKKRTGLKVFLVLLVIIILATAAFYIVRNIIPNFKLIKPKNLGVNYTQVDYQNAVAKTGVNITFDGMSGQQLEKFKADSKNKDANIEDYNFEFSNYQQQTFTLTPSEATALLNEIAPGFFWFNDIQVKANPDGTMEGSSTLKVDKILNDLFYDVKDQIPSELSALLPSTVNIYSRGTINIQNNQLTGNPEEFKIGPVNVPQKYMDQDGIEVMDDMFSRIYTVIPGFEIYSLGSDSNGNFLFDGLIPQTVNVTHK